MTCRAVGLHTWLLPGMQLITKVPQELEVTPQSQLPTPSPQILIFQRLAACALGAGPAEPAAEVAYK